MSARTLTALAEPAHARIAGAMQRAQQAAAQGRRDEAADAYDRLVAELTAHLIGMEVVVDSEFARRVPHAALTVRQQMSLTRRIESALRLLQRLLWGRPVPPGATLTTARSELNELLALHRRQEAEVLRILDAALTEEERRDLAARLEVATRHAPDRPHPHALRSLAATRVLYRPVAAWDRVFDQIDSRPDRAGGPAHEARSLWDGYVLGRPVPPQRRDDR